MRTWLLLLPLLLTSAGARAGVENLELLDAAQGESFLLNALTPPVLGANGTAYWRAAIDYELGGSTLESDAGTLATDARTEAEPGDWPLQGRPTDVLGSSVLLLGTYFPDVFQSTAALFSHPGLTRLVYYGSEFPGFTSDPTGLQVSIGFYDGDGTIVFGMRRATTFPNFTWTICRQSGAGITILAQSGVTAVPEAGGATFSLIRNPVVSGGVILFYGEGGGRRGVYQMVGGTITTVVDGQTTLPPNAGPVLIGSANDVDYANDGHDVAIVLKQGNGGVWKRIGGVWSRVVALNAPIPGGVGNFFSFTTPAIRDGVVVFLGGRDNPFALPLQAGIYTDAFGDVVPIVDLATPFDHADPRSFTVADGGRWFDGSDVAFAVEGTDWRELQRGTPVPEPAGGLAAAALAVLARTARRRRILALKR